MIEIIDIKETADFYNNVENVWGNNDPWHLYSQSTIAHQLSKIHFEREAFILNAGSAGNTYGIDCPNMYHVDIASKKLSGIEKAYVASIEEMPFEDNFFDYIVCVGSVINYCDALTSIHEMSRVIKPKGLLILEYESSYGYEYYGKPYYGADATIVTVQYLGKTHKQWLYSPEYIKNTLKGACFGHISDFKYHIIDGIVYRWIGEKAAVNLLPLDALLRHIPIISDRSNNHFLTCTKN